jgi:hypothetical protein
MGLTLTFDEVAGAVQYLGALATAGDTVFTFFNAEGVPFASAGPLANPPEVILNFSTDAPTGAGPNMPLMLAGFQFPIVAGTETDGVVANNYFDNGIQYQFGVQARNNQGILGPLTTVLLGDSVAPALNTMTLAGAIGAQGVGNDINTTVGAGTVSAMTNTTTPFTLLENFFATAAAGDMTGDTAAITEGMASTVGFDFASITGATDETMTLGFAAPDIFYSAADYAMITGGGATLNLVLTIQANEDLDSTVTPMLPTFTAASAAGLPGFTGGGATIAMGAVDAAAFATGLTPAITTVTLPVDTDMLTDENLIALTLNDIRNFTTGDLVDLASTGITDEAGNAFMGTVRIANASPAAIATAIARTGPNNTHELELTTDRPIVFDAGTVDAMNVLGVALGIRNGDATALTASPAGGMATLSNGNRTLTITGIDPVGGTMGLSDVTTTTVLDGTGLSTNDPLNFQAFGNFPAGLPVNLFEVGQAAIILADQIPPRVPDPNNLPTSAQDAAAGVPNGVPLNTVQMNADGFWSVGDVVMAGDMVQTFQVALTFSEPVFVADAMGDFAPDARASLTFSLAAAAVVGGVANPDPAMYAISGDTMVSIPAAPDNMTVVLQFDLTLGTVAVQDTLTIVTTDLTGNAIDMNGDDIRLGTIGAPTGFTVE